MATARLGRAGVVAVTLAMIGSVVVLANEVVGYRATGGVDWGDVALAVGVPALMYAIVRGAADRHSTGRREPD